jgi:spermidine/putrescine transport system substrate-binding protein
MKMSMNKSFLRIFFTVPVLAVAFAAISLSFVGCTKSSKEVQEVNLAIWGNYLAPETIEKFTKETGIKVNVSNYTSNEELLAKVQAGSSGIDVAVPSDYMVSILKSEKLLEPINQGDIPNMKLIAKEFLNQGFDEGNKVSLPYSWATAGIAVNRELYKGKITSWKDLFNNADLKGKVSLLDDVREVAAAALKMDQKSVNSTDEAELKKAKESLLALKPRVKMFSSDTIEALVRKEVAVAQSYSTDALQAAAKSDGKIEYILPEEGGTKSIDNVVIIKGAKNIKAAHQLINFMLSSETNLAFVKSVFGGPVLTTTKALLPENIQNNKSLFPASEQMSRFESINDIGEKTQMYDDLWTQIKTE